MGTAVQPTPDTAIVIPLLGHRLSLTRDQARDLLVWLADHLDDDVCRHCRDVVLAAPPITCQACLDAGHTTDLQACRASGRCRGLE